MASKIIEYAISLAVAAIPWVIPDCSVEYKIIAALAAFILFLLLQLYSINQKLKDVKQELQTTQKQMKDREIKHNALAAQFELKSVELKKYSDAFKYIGQQLTIATLTPKEAKLKALLEFYLQLKHNLIEGGQTHD